jgi:hypothetical protein
MLFRVGQGSAWLAFAVLISSTCGGRVERTCSQDIIDLSNRCNAAVAPTRIAGGGIDFVARTASGFGSFPGGVVISACPDTCAAAGGDPARGRSAWLQLGLSFGNVGWHTGHFTFGPSVDRLVDGGLGPLDGRFQAELVDRPEGGSVFKERQYSASAGTVDIDAFDGFTRVAGRYDLIFPDGSHIAGAFDAPFCLSAARCSP